MSAQLFNRFCRLVVVGADDGIDLSEFRIVFRVHQNDFESPNHAEIRVYNLSRETMDKIQGEGTTYGKYTKVHLEAGYQNGENFGTIFEGTISQLHRGRENNTETYIDILAADGDFYNDIFVAETQAKRTTMKERVEAISKDANGNAITVNHPPQSDAKYWATPSLRGKVLFGMWRSEIRKVAQTAGCSWSIQNGAVQIIPLDGYKEGEAVELNSATGLIGVPKQTDEGVEMQCLLNPKIIVGGLIKTSQESINQTILNSMIPHNQWAGLQFVAPLSPDGNYRVLVAEHHGDTRGHEWYTDIVGMAIDASGKVVLAR